MNVYLLLDRSGSMSTLWSEAIGSINGYVAKLKKSDKVTVAAFDSVSYDVVRDVKVADWTDIKSNEVEPRGGTPLYDACGKLMAQAEQEKAKKTVLVVMTDGFENASQEYTQAAIKAKIEAFEKKKWEVIFLGANFDAISSVSSGLGVVGSKTMNYGVGNFARGMDMLATSTNAYAATGAAMNFTDDQKKTLSSSL
jgi:Mg-chelatase subunit ChlD